MHRAYMVIAVGALAACSSGGIGNNTAEASPVSGGTDTRLTVLGLQADDTPAVALQKLSKEGFALDTAYDQCRDVPSFGDVVKDMKSRGFTNVGGIQCTQRFADKSNRTVEASYTLFSRGYLLSRVSYAMPYTGTQADLETIMKKKYGAPASAYQALGGPIAQYTTPTDLRSQTYLRVFVNPGRATVTMEDKGAYKMLQSGKELSTATAKASGGDNLKL